MKNNLESVNHGDWMVMKRKKKTFKNASYEIL